MWIKQRKKITDNEIKSFSFFCKQNIQKRFYNRETNATLNYEIHFPTPFPFMQLKLSTLFLMQGSKPIMLK